MTAALGRARFLASAGAVFAAVWARPVRAQQLQKVQLVTSFDDALTPVCWGIHSRAYEKAGLDVELVLSNTGTAATTAVISGAYALGKGSAIASLVAHLRGLPLAVIANSVLWDPRAPSAVTVVATDSPLKRPRDLSGKIGAAAALNDLDTVTIAAWVDKDGGDSKSMKWIEVPNSASVEALAEHRIDVAQLREPLYTAAIESGKVRPLAGGLASNAIAPSFAISVFFANKDFAEQNPQLMRSFARVTYESARYTNAHHAETEQLMSDTTKLPLDVMRKINRPPGATSGDPGLIQPVIDVAARYGNIARTFSAKDLYFGSA